MSTTKQPTLTGSAKNAETNADRHIASRTAEDAEMIAERHRISKQRLAVVRAAAEEKRKRRRLSAPATVHHPGGRVITRKTRKDVTHVLDDNVGYDCNDTNLKAKAVTCGYVRQQLTTHVPVNNYTEPEEDYSVLSIDGINSHEAMYEPDITRTFEACDIDDHNHSTVDLPPPSLTACLDEDEWGIAEPCSTEQTGIHNSEPACVDRQSDEHLPVTYRVGDTEHLTKRLKSVLSWDKFVSYMSICGRAPFSAEQYMFLRGVVATLSGDQHLQDYKSVRRQMSNNLSSWCFPKSSVYYINHFQCPQSTSVIKTIMTCNKGRKAVQGCVRIVMPTEWAKLDVASYPIYSDIFEHPYGDSEETLSIERSPIVQRRSSFIGRKQALWVWFNGVPCYARIGDTVSLPCADRPNQVEKSCTVNNSWFKQHVATSERTRVVTDVEAVVCGLWIIGNAPHPGERRPPRRPAPEGSEYWTDHERALQSKFSDPSPNSDAMELVLEDQATEKKKQFLGNASVHEQARLGYSTNVVSLHPGDQCVLLRNKHVHEQMAKQGLNWNEDNKTQHCMLVGSLVRQALGLSAERLVWVEIDETKEGNASIRYVGSANVTDMPTWVCGTTKTPSTCYETGPVRNTGHMHDGSRYLVYRFALYMDGFKQTKSQRDTRSVGGCYMMPLGLSLEARRNTGAPHVITLASSSVSHNDVLHLIMENISRAAVNGVDGVDPHGRRVRIFLDPVTFFGDYPAAALCADTVGHIGNAFCTHCSVSKRRSPSGSRILGAHAIHSRRVGFARTDVRMEAIRESPLKAAVLKSLGMKSRDRLSGRKLPLVHLSYLCRSAVPERNEKNEDVVPVMFESSLSCAAVPDHLFNGLIKNTLNAAFDSVRNNTTLRRLEKRILTMLHENGLPVTGRLLKWGSRKEYSGLVNQTMSGFMCILLCSATAFHDLYTSTHREVFRLVRRLQELVSAVYFWPSRNVDGDRHSNMFTTEGRMLYYRKLINMCKEYLANCDAIMAEDEQAGAVLDKPNAHRALEFVMHTIPCFGHAFNCSEMVLELMHQVFKRWLEKNTHQDSHITAVERALAKDWMGRVFALYSIWKNGDSRERACSELGLRRLILGEEGIILDDRHPGVSYLMQQFHSAINSTLRSPNDIAMSKCGHVRLPRARRQRWVVNSKDKVTPGKEDLGVEAIAGYKLVEKVHCMREGWGTKECQQYSAARLRAFDLYEQIETTYKYNELRVGQVISFVCSRAAVIQREEEGGGEVHFFAVCLLIEVRSEKKLWAVCRRMQGKQVEGRWEYCVDKEGVCLVELHRYARRAGAAVVSECDEHRQQGESSIARSGGVVDGGRYELWSRKDGFPPHMG